MMTNTQIFGRIVSVEERNEAEALTVTTASGDTVISVADAATFNEKGGTLLIDGVQKTYTAIDADANTITLSGTVGAVVEEQSLIEVYPAEPVATALVDIGDDGDPITATVPHALVSALTLGTRTAEAGEMVELQTRGPEYIVADILGRELNDIPSSRIDYGMDAPSGGNPLSLRQFLDFRTQLSYLNQNTAILATTTINSATFTQLTAFTLNVNAGALLPLALADDDIYLQITMSLDCTVGTTSASDAMVIQCYTTESGGYEPAVEPTDFVIGAATAGRRPHAWTWTVPIYGPLHPLFGIPPANWDIKFQARRAVGTTASWTLHGNSKLDVVVKGTGLTGP